VRGFSLIEVIGALALVSIAAAFVAVHLIRVMQEERRRHEVQMADRLAEAFEQAIILHKTVPSTNPASWVPLLASQLGLPADAVGTNSIGTPRLLVYDPSLKIGTTTPASLPYVQGSAGATNVINPRVIILSGLQAGYPPVDFSSAAGFSNLWNRADHTLPMDWPANWAADPDDLVVRRLDLSGLFHEVVFNNLDPFHPAPYAVLTNTLAGGGHANVIAVTNQPVAGRFIRGTPLRLSYANGQPQVVNIVTSDASYVFEQGRWNRSAQSGLTGPATYGPLGSR
jgi:prepilin-type N-terminal cleavage/methylation domain-containing protein